MNTAKRELVECGVLGATALGLAAFFHVFFPGAGAVLKPMFWPLLALACRVRTSYAVVTCAAVPLMSCAITGMPKAGAACVLAVLLPLAAVAVGLARAAVAAHRARA